MRGNIQTKKDVIEHTIPDAMYWKNSYLCKL